MKYETELRKGGCSKSLKYIRYTLHDFSRGCKKDDLKYATDFPSEVLSHSAKRSTQKTGGKMLLINTKKGGKMLLNHLPQVQQNMEKTGIPCRLSKSKCLPNSTHFYNQI